MRVYLIQHGDALSKDVDPERALSGVGCADIERLAVFLEKTDLAVTRVLQSGKTRARQTAEILATRLAPMVVIEAASGIDPLDDPEPLARQLEASEESIAIVGHLPFLGKLVSRLVAGNEAADIVSFQPGSVVCLERSEDKWTIAWMLRPELLKQ